VVAEILGMNTHAITRKREAIGIPPFVARWSGAEKVLLGTDTDGERKPEGAMKDFKGKVAVITGAASGIGRALAERCVREGMKAVLADVEVEALAKTEASLKASGATVLAVPTDVSQARDVAALAQKTLQVFGAVHLLFNNAGVATEAAIWESSLDDWEWVVGVNLWGVIHGVRAFVPVMLAQNTECHIVNTASMAGLVSGPGLGAYKVTKHAVVSLSETLYHELAERGARVGVSVLCPAFVNTRIMESARNRPGHLAPEAPLSPAPAARKEALNRLVPAGIPPVQVADAVFAAVRKDEFYILTHPDGKESIRTRMEDILQERNPTPPEA
jgi:NAD(P)-dependent dehydrogenase (short-subunit alcohol dehydrogenase family)